MLRIICLIYLASMMLMGCAETMSEEPDVQSSGIEPTNVEQNQAKLQKATTF